MHSCRPLVRQSQLLATEVQPPEIACDLPLDRADSTLDGAAKRGLQYRNRSSARSRAASAAERPMSTSQTSGWSITDAIRDRSAQHASWSEGVQLVDENEVSFSSKR
jgi:hypothetical protein